MSLASFISMLGCLVGTYSMMHEQSSKLLYVLNFRNSCKVTLSRVRGPRDFTSYNLPHLNKLHAFYMSLW